MQGTCSSLIKMISHFDLNVTHLVFCYCFFTVKKHFLNRLISAFCSLLQWLEADSKLPSCTHECTLIIKVFAICPLFKQRSGTPQRQFSENISSEDDLRSRTFGTFVVKFLACLPLLGFKKMV